MGRLFKWLIPLALITFGLLWPLVIRGGSEASDPPRKTTGQSSPKTMSANGISQRISRHMATS